MLKLKFTINLYTVKHSLICKAKTENVAFQFMFLSIHACVSIDFLKHKSINHKFPIFKFK